MKKKEGVTKRATPRAARSAQYCFPFFITVFLFCGVFCLIPLPSAKAHALATNPPELRKPVPHESLSLDLIFIDMFAVEADPTTKPLASEAGWVYDNDAIRIEIT